MRNMLNKTEHFLNANQLHLQDCDNARLLDGSLILNIINNNLIQRTYLDAGDVFDVEDPGYGSMKFNIVAGVIDRSRYLNQC